MNLAKINEIIRNGNPKDALPHLINLVNSNPDFPLYRRKLHEIQVLLGLAERGEQKNQSRDLEKTKEGAIKAFEQGLFRECLQICDALIAADKGNVEALKIAEQAAIELGEFQRANAYWLARPAAPYPEVCRQRSWPAALPPYFTLPAIKAPGNDYSFFLEQFQVKRFAGELESKTVSVIMPVYNRSKLLANALAGLCNQTYPPSLIEVIVVDDGSSDDVLKVIRKYESKLNLYYVRQKDNGYRLAAARNLGINLARHEFLLFMDADILPETTDIENYMGVAGVTDNAVLIGHRRYVDVSKINDDQILSDPTLLSILPSINPNNDVADARNDDGESIDWRFKEYAKSSFLINDLWPFSKAAGGNVLVSKRLAQKVGGVDEEFNAWGCEDGEFFYRIYNEGAYFVPMMNIISLHQEPIGAPAEKQSDDQAESFRRQGLQKTKQIYESKCPAPILRRYGPGKTFDIPKVSIYMPLYNAEAFVEKAIQSVREQQYGDWELVICDDGSTDRSYSIVSALAQKDPRIRLFKQENRGIAATTNACVSGCRGMYIGQLDADDLLKESAIQECVRVLDTLNVDAVYADCDYIDGEGKFIRHGWCGGNFLREAMIPGMIATHFRMFRKRLWSRAGGCSTDLSNAVDFDLWLKFNEVGRIEHIHKVLYSYRWHGNNTSVSKRKAQEENHFKALGRSLSRLGLGTDYRVVSSRSKLDPRAFSLLCDSRPLQKLSELLVLNVSCRRNLDKVAVQRETWMRELKVLGARCITVIADPTLTVAEFKEDVLTVPCEDNYESLILKLVLAYDFIYKHFDFVYLLKIDDDVVLNTKLFIEKIVPQLNGNHYMGGQVHKKGVKMNTNWHIGKCSDKRFEVTYPHEAPKYDFGKGGYGYFLHRAVFPVLQSEIQAVRDILKSFKYLYEDIKVSEILGARGVHVSAINSYSVTKYTEDEAFLNKAVVFYDISSAESLKNQFDLIKHL